MRLSGLGVAAAVVAPHLGGMTSGAFGAEAPFLPYTADSFFKSSVVGAPVDAARTSQFLNFMNTFPDQRNYKWPRIQGLGGNKWGTVYALGTSSDPIWKLTGSMNAKCNILKTQGFHAPDWLGSALTGTSDSPFCVVDPVFGYTMFGGKAKVVAPRTIQVSSAGVTYHSSNGLDYRNPRSTDSRNFTSRGRISDSMVIRRDLVDNAIATGGDLGHTLHLFIAESRTADGFCHPMTGPESGKYGFGAEGERIAIKPSVNLETKGLSPVALVVARTLQNYGCYIGDNAGGASTLKAEQISAGRNPWAGLTVSQDMLKGLVWEDWFVLPKGWQG